MKIPTIAIVSILTVSLLSTSRVRSFALPVRHSDSTRNGRSDIGLNDRVLSFAPRRSESSAMRLRSSEDGNAAVEGTGRGLFVMAISLFACVWIFSIPPEFRRAHICTSNRPSSVVVDGSNKCVPLGAWVDDVADYYRGGGGVQFDFSIDQSTRDFWSGGR